jgi:hypothetical protein
MLDKEYAYYETIKQDLLSDRAGKFAAIVGEELIGAFDTDQAAYEAALHSKGNVPMLIVRIGAGEAKEAFVAPALLTGLIHADPQI